MLKVGFERFSSSFYIFLKVLFFSSNRNLLCNFDTVLPTLSRDSVAQVSRHSSEYEMELLYPAI